MHLKRWDRKTSPVFFSSNCIPVAHCLVACKRGGRDANRCLSRFLLSEKPPENECNVTNVDDDSPRRVDQLRIGGTRR